MFALRGLNSVLKPFKGPIVAIQRAGLHDTLHNVRMHLLYISDEDIIKILRIIQSADAPVLIHCLNGSDRTGVVAAMYRIVLQNWSKEEALNEMVNGGYGFHRVFININKYIDHVNIDRIRQEMRIQ